MVENGTQSPAPYRHNFFKYSTLGILFILIIAQVINTPTGRKIIPDFVSIAVALVCVFYLWLAERKDIDILRRTNVKLLAAQEAIRESHIDTMLSLILSQEAKDSYTYGHSERVRQYSVFLAHEMGLEKDEIDVISRAAKLHDIGKIGIRDEVLFYKEKLTNEQYDLIKAHPTKGLVILEPLKFLNHEKKIVRHHHERWDGKGYPDGLKGETIPLGARIIAVADAFDAMRSHRPYSPAMSKKEIIYEFETNSGVQFDPQVVDIFLKNIERFYV